MKYATVCLLAMFLFACKSTVENIKVDNDLITSPDQGYLLIGIQTSHDLKSMLLTGQAGIELTHKDLSADADYILINLPAGDYKIRKIDLSKYFYLSFDEDLIWDFTIQAGKVNYIGHLEMFTRGYYRPSTYVDLVNKSSQALQFMQESYPTILNKRSLVFGGTGNDEFLTFVAEQQGETE
ncbi:hypothetical protein [Glaciecola sp.]|jgi:hypothetical protein|uniref:hypothetical protein n=1 Tax=Glaciecola sp. MF2-115 TaxID=3384827 RepID=UPI0039890C82